MRRILRRFFAADVSVATTTAGVFFSRWQTTSSTTSTTSAAVAEEEEGTTPLASASLEEWLVMAQDRLHQLEMGHVATPLSSSTPTSSSPSISATSSLPSSSTQVTRQHINNNNNNVAAVRQRQHTNALELISDLELLASSAPSVATLTASSLLLAGLDTKAVFSQGSNGFHDVSLHGKDFSRSDFTGIQLVNVCGLESSFARSTWYRVVLHDSCFVDCNLQGCILKHLTVRVSGNDGVLEQHDDEEDDEEEEEGQMRQTEPLIPFTRCDFRYAMIDLSQTAEDWINQNHHTSGAAATTTRRGGAAPSSSTPSTPPPRVMFADCDFYMAAIHLGPRAARDAEWRRQVLRLFQNAKGWDHALVVD